MTTPAAFVDTAPTRRSDVADTPLRVASHRNRYSPNVSKPVAVVEPEVGAAIRTAREVPIYRHR
jgi:hypothetical protein